MTRARLRRVTPLKRHNALPMTTLMITQDELQALLTLIFARNIHATRVSPHEMTRRGMPHALSRRGKRTHYLFTHLRMPFLLT